MKNTRINDGDGLMVIMVVVIVVIVVKMMVMVVIVMVVIVVMVNTIPSSVYLNVYASLTPSSFYVAADSRN